MNYTTVSNRLRAVVEEMDEDEIFGGAEVAEDEEMASDDDLLEAQINAVAALLGVEVDELMEASEEEVLEALGALSDRLTEAKMKFAAQSVKYGRGGMKRSCMPWKKNEGGVGHATPHAAPSRSGPPGTKKAKQHKPATPTYGPGWMK